MYCSAPGVAQGAGRCPAARSPPRVRRPVRAWPFQGRLQARSIFFSLYFCPFPFLAEFVYCLVFIYYFIEINKKKLFFTPLLIYFVQGLWCGLACRCGG